MKKKLNKILFITTSLFFSIQNVFGATYNTFVYNMEDEDNNVIKRYFDGESAIQKSIKIGEHESDSINGYCIDVGAKLDERAYINRLEDLEDYLGYVLSESVSEEDVANKINQYVQFGYGYKNQKSDKYLIATQKLIWDELYNVGYRKSHYGSNVTFKAGQKEYDISNEETTIKNNIKNYYKTPSMCSSTSKLEIAVGETVTYEDTNKVLSNYEVICDDGLTCTVDEDVLKVTANSDIKDQKIKFSKSGINGSGTIIYKKEEQQAVLVGAEPIEGVSCEFGIDTYKNVQTSGAKIVGLISLSILSIMIAYIIITNNQQLKVE